MAQTDLRRIVKRTWLRLLQVVVLLAAVVLPLVPSPTPVAAYVTSTSIVMRLKVPLSGDVDLPNSGYLFEGQYATVNISNWNSPTGGSGGTGWSGAASAYDGNTATAAVYSWEGWSTNYTFTFASANVVGWKFWLTYATEVEVDIYDSTNTTWKNKFSGSCAQGSWVIIDFSETVLTVGTGVIAESSAQLKGTITSLGSYTYTEVFFQYGTSTDYGYATDAQELNSIGNFDAIADGLLYNKTYHFRAVARFDNTYIFGEDNVLTTLPAEGSSTDISIETVGVFSSYLLSGDYLFAIEARNSYTNLYPAKKPGQYFTLQLVDTNNTDVLAASPLPSWGDRPASIYLNPTASTIIVEGAAYYIKMVGDATSGNATTVYQLTSADWYGSDLTHLDQWCRGVARHMAASESTSIWDFVRRMTDMSEIISEEAGGYFVVGIPGITTVRPNLFAASSLYGTSPSGTANDTWYSLTAWQTYVGPTITADATIFALPFGITGKDFLAGFIMLVIAGFIMVVTGAMGGFGALGAALLALPILWLGMFFRIEPSWTVGMVLFFFGIFAIRQFVVKTL